MADARIPLSGLQARFDCRPLSHIENVKTRTGGLLDGNTAISRLCVAIA
jgi:hypothetical protein